MDIKALETGFLLSLVVFASSCGSRPAGTTSAVVRNETVSEPQLQLTDAGADEPADEHHDGGPQDGGAPEAEDVLTFEELRDGPERSGTVKVRAYFKGIVAKQQCHEEEPCRHPVALTYLSPEDTGGGQTYVSVEDHPPEWQKLDRYTAYTFVLELSEGYRESLAPRSDQLKLRLVGCDDCPRTRETTLEALVEEPEQPGYAQVRAYLISSSKPAPCPPRHKCQPAAAATIITSDPTGEDEIRLCAHGLIRKAKKLARKGEPLTFVLKIDEGYKAHIGTELASCGDPRWYPISLFDCPDCRP